MKRTSNESRRLVKQIQTCNVEVSLAMKDKLDTSMARKITVCGESKTHKEKPLRDGSPESGKQI